MSRYPAMLQAFRGSAGGGVRTRTPRRARDFKPPARPPTTHQSVEHTALIRPSTRSPERRFSHSFPAFGVGRVRVNVPRATLLGIRRQFKGGFYPCPTVSVFQNPVGGTAKRPEYGEGGPSCVGRFVFGHRRWPLPRSFPWSRFRVSQPGRTRASKVFAPSRPGRGQPPWRTR